MFCYGIYRSNDYQMHDEIKMNVYLNIWNNKKKKKNFNIINSCLFISFVHLSKVILVELFSVQLQNLTK